MESQGLLHANMEGGARGSGNRNISLWEESSNRVRLHVRDKHVRLFLLWYVGAVKF